MSLVIKCRTRARLPGKTPRSRWAAGPVEATFVRMNPARRSFAARHARRGFHSGAALTAVLAALLVLFVRVPNASAAAPSAELLARLATHAAQFEELKKRASYTIDARLEDLDGDGHVEIVKQLLAHVIADGERGRFDVVRYVEGGEDKTSSARDKAERERAAAKKERRRFRMPFHEAEQGRYAFDVVEVDRADAARVRIAFVPRTVDATALEGSAWVDTRVGTVLSAGFKLSKPATFVDFVHVTLEFGERTPLGPAVSRASLEGKGGFLFFRKHFRGAAKLFEYRVRP